MAVKWGNITSQFFKISNGVRQGGILSPRFFNVYVNDLSDRLNKLNIGCILGDLILNHLMYADDLVLISPSTYGLENLLEVCENYGIEFDIKFNSNKSAIMFIKPANMLDIQLPVFRINNEVINVETEYRGKCPTFMHCHFHAKLFFWE